MGFDPGVLRGTFVGADDSRYTQAGLTPDQLHSSIIANMETVRGSVFQFIAQLEGRAPENMVSLIGETAAHFQAAVDDFPRSGNLAVDAKNFMGYVQTAMTELHEICTPYQGLWTDIFLKDEWAEPPVDPDDPTRWAHDAAATRMLIEQMTGEIESYLNQLGPQSDAPLAGPDAGEHNALYRGPGMTGSSLTT